MELPATTNEVPSGIWAIASELTPDDLPQWMKNASVADCWTFRIPKASDDQSIEMLRSMRQSAPWLAVHAELEWALAVNAQAVIGGSRSLKIEELRKRLDLENQASDIKLGKAAHNERELLSAQNSDADFVFFSPIYETPSKRGILNPHGLNRLAKVVAEMSIPVIALGGIQTAEHVIACKEVGAHGVAMLRAGKDRVLLKEMSSAWYG
jgi:thiamine-phosphate pyrophosphorylase